MICRFNWFHGIIQQDPSDDQIRKRPIDVQYGVPCEMFGRTPRASEHKSAFALDETPINPDSPLLTDYTVHNGVTLPNLKERRQYGL